MSNLTAEQQFNLFARLVEHIVANQNEQTEGKNLIEWIRDLDLYLWTQEKCGMAEEYCKKEVPSIESISPDLFPCIMVNPRASTIISEFYVTEKGLVLDFVCGSGASGDCVQTAAVSAMALSMGTVVIPLSAVGMRTAYLAKYSFCLEQMMPDKTWLHTPVSEMSHWERDASIYVTKRCIEDALSQALYVMKPRNVLVVESTKRSQKMKNKKHGKGVAPRAGDREVHIVLDPDELRTVRKAAATSRGSSHASPVPHKRRPHKRTFKADRYKKAKGRTKEFGEIYVNCKPGEKICLPRKVYHVKRVSDE